MRITSSPVSQSITNYQNNSYNTSFGYKIKNPTKMPNAMLSALLSIEDIFAAYPNATVKLKHLNKFVVRHQNDGGYPLHTTRHFGRNMTSCLVFDLDGKIKFRICSNTKHTGIYDKKFSKQLKDALPGSSHASRIKKENTESLIKQINKTNIKSCITKAINREHNKNDAIEYRKGLIERAKSLS